MANADLITFEDIYLSALRRLKSDPEDPETLIKVKEIINTRQRWICSRKKWRFLRITNRSLTLPQKVTTGTITVTNGSRSIVGAGTAFNQTHVGWYLNPVGVDNSYRVISVKDATHLTVSSNYVGSTVAGATYKLYQCELAMFPDLEDIDDMRIEGLRKRIEPVGASVINHLKQKFPQREGRPEVYTIEGMAKFKGPVLGQFILGYDFLGSKQVRSVSFFPHIPDKDYQIHVPYKRKIDPLINATDEPIIPVQNRSILLYYALSDMYASNDSSMAQYYQKLGDKEFDEMIAHFLDTDDVIQMKPVPTRSLSHWYLLRHSNNYFDTEG